MVTDENRTENGQWTRTRYGWLWTCAHCHSTLTLGTMGELEGFDAQRWADQVDAMHYCEHKGETG